MREKRQAKPKFQDSNGKPRVTRWWMADESTREVRDSDSWHLGMGSSGTVDQGSNLPTACYTIATTTDPTGLDRMYANAALPTSSLPYWHAKDCSTENGYLCEFCKSH